MVVVPACVLVVEVRLSQRGGIGLARPAILLLAAIGGPGARQSAGAGLRNATRTPRAPRGPGAVPLPVRESTAPPCTSRPG